MKYRRILLILIVVGQLVVLGSLIARQEYKWRTWRTIQLKVAPYDPIALFRGRYVQLTYEFSMLGLPGESWREGETVYLRLKPVGDGTWRMSDLGRTMEKGPDEILLQATVAFTQGDRVGIRAGIESYFMSERKAPEIELLSPREYDMRVDVAVSEGGQAVLKQLYINGIPAEEFDPAGGNR